MPNNWLSRLIGNGGGNHADGQNNLDSLFKLPLQPPLPEYKDGINVAASRFSATVNRAIANFSVAEARQQLMEVSEAEWVRRGEERALALFHAAAEYVPAYKDFLQKNKVDSAS